MIEIRLHGRGGQGVVLAARLIAEAAVSEGKYVQAFPEFGAERSGAPIAAHHVPYAATASISHWKDLMTKVRRGLSKSGPTFLHVLSPCTRGWRYEASQTIKVSKLAVETRVFPLYEVEDGVYRLTVPVTHPRPMEDYLSCQGRFAHLLQPENSGELDRLKKEVELNYNRLEKLSQLTPQLPAIQG